MGAPLVPGQGVDLVDDDGGRRAQQPPGSARGQQQVERLGRGDQERGRAAQEAARPGGGGVAGADADGQLGRVEAEAAGLLGDLWSGRSRFSRMSMARARSGET